MHVRIEGSAELMSLPSVGRGGCIAGANRNDNPRVELTRESHANKTGAG
jgi:hypothetical protein